MLKLLFLFLSTLLIASVASAGELRIVDGLGLTRAVKSIGRDAKVVIVASAKGGAALQDLSLVHVDGLASDHEGVAQGEHHFVFNAVEEGAWKIKSSSPQVVVSEVKIVQ